VTDHARETAVEDVTVEIGHVTDLVARNAAVAVAREREVLLRRDTTVQSHPDPDHVRPVTAARMATVITIWTEMREKEN
jgi:hypothetical protein